MKKMSKLLVSSLLLSVMLVGATSASASTFPGPCYSPKPCLMQ